MISREIGPHPSPTLLEAPPHPVFTPEEGRFYQPSELPSAFTQGIVDATVMIHHPDKLDNTGSGVLAIFDGQVYLITAAHVLKTMYPGEEYKSYKPGLTISYHNLVGDLTHIPFSKQNVLYQPTIARKKGLPWGDLAIVRWPTKLACNPVEIAELSQEGVSELGLLTTVGFPVSQHDNWKETQVPMLSFGSAKRYYGLAKDGFLNHLNTSIRTDGGNSGGGIFADGKLLAVTSMGGLGSGCDGVLVHEVLQAVLS